MGVAILQYATPVEKISVFLSTTAEDVKMTTATSVPRNDNIH